MRTRLAFAFPFVLVLSVAFAPVAVAQPLPPEKAKPALLKLLDRPKVDADVKQGEASPARRTRAIYEQWSFASEKKADGTIRSACPCWKVSTCRGRRANCR